MSNSLDSIARLDSLNLYGYSVTLFNDIDYGQVALKVAHITRADVSLYTFFIAEQTFKNAEV